MKNEQSKIETKEAPDLKTFRSKEKGKFRLRNIIVGLVFFCSFYTAMQGQIVTIPFAALALWMAFIE
jgi:hypothetical protein